MKLKLDLDELANDFFDNTRLAGIVAPLKSYQFCWHLNHLLHYDFRINNDIEIQLQKKSGTIIFRCLNTANRQAAWYIIYITTNTTVNTCCPNSGTLIFYG
jgi:hypothetical protein